jgi:SAM-dependent methyltransferase
MILTNKKAQDAEFYDGERYDVEAFRHYKPLYERAIKLIGRGRVLDLGCGVGNVARLRGVQGYVGVDFSMRMLKKAPKNADVVCGELRALGVDLGKFDKFLCLETLEHLDDDLAVLDTLPKGAFFVGSVPSFDSEAHVRYFTGCPSVTTRYARFLREMRCEKVKKWFVFWGYKK